MSQFVYESVMVKFFTMLSTCFAYLSSTDAMHAFAAYTFDIGRSDPLL
jgi:hypothetical protein